MVQSNIPWTGQLQTNSGSTIRQTILDKVELLLDIYGRTAHYSGGPSLSEQSELNKAVLKNLLALVKEVFPEPVKPQEVKPQFTYMQPPQLGNPINVKKDTKVVSKEEQEFMDYLLEVLKVAEAQQNKPFTGAGSY